jgi:hypothetical protein
MLEDGVAGAVGGDGVAGRTDPAEWYPALRPSVSGCKSVGYCNVLSAIVTCDGGWNDSESR